MKFRIGMPEVSEDDQGYFVESALVVGETSPSLWFRTPSHLKPDETTLGDAFLASMLPMAMARGEDIVIDAPVSARLLESLDEIQKIYAGWYPDVLQQVEIEASATNTAPVTGKGTLSTFTGGVDSFYTLVKHKDEITSVLYVEGFDVPITNAVLARSVRKTVSSVAEAYGVQATFLQSNLKSFTDRVTDWGLIAHGPALASVGLLLQGHFDTMYIPSTHSLKQMFPWGSHVLVDHLWSTERLTFIHDGADASRVTKTKTIAQEKPVQEYLRVCWQNRGPYNCGSCEKCLRTMTALDLMDALDKFTVFPDIDLPEAVRNLRIANQNGLEFQLENLEYAQEISSTKPVVAALQESIDAYRERNRDAPSTKPPYVGSRAAREQRIRAEVVELRKEVKELRRANAALQAQLSGAERRGPRRVRRALGRVVRKVIPRRG